MNKSSTLLSQFGKRVRDLRLAKGLSQEDFAAICNLDRTYISSLERGKRNVGLKNVATIAKALAISLSQLFDGIDEDEG